VAVVVVVVLAVIIRLDVVEVVVRPLTVVLKVLEEVEVT
jgi:hypothetical protein